MNLKDILVGGAVTLAVTIVSGIAIYFITREPSQRADLFYRSANSVAFGGAQTTFTVTTLEIGNNGSGPADDVKIYSGWQESALSETKKSLPHPQS